MADVLRVSQIAVPTDSAPSAGLFDRAGVRYEVACDVIGALIAHYAEIMGREREQAQPNEAVLRVAGAMKAALALEGLAMSADDLAVQALLIRGDITHDEAVQCYRILHRHAQ
jgi:6,7-dimethyl-8-ribityllumazine synthase